MISVFGCKNDRKTRFLDCSKVKETRIIYLCLFRNRNKYITEQILSSSLSFRHKFWHRLCLEVMFISSLQILEKLARSEEKLAIKFLNGTLVQLHNCVVLQIFKNFVLLLILFKNNASWLQKTWSFLQYQILMFHKKTLDPKVS